MKRVDEQSWLKCFKHWSKEFCKIFQYFTISSVSNYTAIINKYAPLSDNSAVHFSILYTEIIGKATCATLS